MADPYNPDRFLSDRECHDFSGFEDAVRIADRTISSGALFKGGQLIEKGQTYRR